MYINFWYAAERDEYKVNELRIQHHKYGFEFMHTFHSPPLKNVLMKRLRNFEGELEAGSGHHGPNGLYTYIHLSPTKWFHQYLYGGACAVLIAADSKGLGRA